jgi:predicted permease
MLSHGVWVGRFGADSSVVGRTISIGGQQLAVVGILPASFALRTPAYAGYAADIEVWTPLRIDVSLFTRPRRRDLDSDNTGIVIARLAPDATFDRAQSAMTAVASAQREQFPSYHEAGIEIEVVPLQEDLVAEAKPALIALQGAVGLVLLIACINVATMLAARGSGRRQELAVRTALGAGRGRLIRQLLSEALVIATIAGIVGIAFAALATSTMNRMSAVVLPAGTAIRIDAPVLAITILVSLAAAVIAGVMPAVVFSAKHFTHALGERSSSGDLMQSRIGRTLIVAQLALSVALLAGAGLLLRSFGELHRVEPGFDPNGLVVFNLDLAGANLGGPAARATFVSGLEERVRQLPGVEAIGLTNAVPLSGAEWSQPYGLPGETEAEWERNSADFRMITSEYFTTMGIGLMAGRMFTAEENVMERERVVIVDRKLARNIDPSGDVLGQHIGFPLDGAPISARIVGIVDNVRHTSLRSEGRETIYVPYRQEASRSVAMAVRTSRDVQSLATALQGELRTINALVPVFDFTLMEAHVNNALAPTRFVMTLVAAFAALSLVLAASGLYGLLSFAVLQRKRELGVRLALGAVERDIVGLVVRGGMLLVLVGLAVGIPASIITSRALTLLLYTVSPWDPLTLLTVGVLLTAVAALACYIPARRASRIDPMTALRVE